MEHLQRTIAGRGIANACFVKSPDVPPGSIILKSLIWILESQPACLVMRHDAVVDLDLVEKCICSRAKLASRREAQELSGFEIGTIPPIAHSTEMPVYVCKDLVDCAYVEGEHCVMVYCGAGKLGHELRIPLQDLLAVPEVSYQHKFSCLDKEDLRHESVIVSPIVKVAHLANAGALVASQRALHSLVIKDGPDTAAVLRNSIRNGCIDHTAEGPAGKYALHIAAWRGTIEVVDILLDNGCDVNTISTGEGNYGKTALFYAITRCRDDMVQHLLTRGALVSIVNNKGQSVISLAATHLSYETQQMLLEHEAHEHARGIQHLDFYATHPDGREYGDLDPRFSASMNFAGA